jgi:hypothetical protein
VSAALGMAATLKERLAERFSECLEANAFAACIEFIGAMQALERDDLNEAHGWLHEWDGDTVQIEVVE